MYLFNSNFKICFIFLTLINKVKLDKQKGIEITVHASCSSSFKLEIITVQLHKNIHQH